MINVERIIYESKKLETLLSLKKGLSHPSYEALIKLEAVAPVGHNAGMNDYFVMTKDLRDVLIKELNRKIAKENQHLEELILNGNTESVTV